MEKIWNHPIISKEWSKSGEKQGKVRFSHDAENRPYLSRVESRAIAEIILSKHFSTRGVKPVPCVKMEFLANYLAELTLVEYRFLKFFPSLIAASAVFLARWILSQSDHPWNPTLEYYTGYVTSDLKGTVLALQELQLNTEGCSLNAIREKYMQQKFKSVATLTSPKRVESIFLKFNNS